MNKCSLCVLNIHNHFGDFNVTNKSVDVDLRSIKLPCNCSYRAKFTVHRFARNNKTLVAPTTQLFSAHVPKTTQFFTSYVTFETFHQHETFTISNTFSHVRHHLSDPFNLITRVSWDHTRFSGEMSKRTEDCASTWWWSSSSQVVINVDGVSTESCLHKVCFLSGGKFLLARTSSSIKFA